MMSVLNYFLPKSLSIDTILISKEYWMVIWISFKMIFSIELGNLGGRVNDIG
jgi:hypothetical protein